MSNEIVTVIIPCYNQGKFLKDAIKSVINQSYPYCEIIVVDDGSPDNVQGITEKFSNVKLIRQPNLGVAIARNKGMAASIGSYLIFLDSDDRLLPNALEEGVRYLKQNQNCAYVSGLIQLIDNEGDFLNIPIQPKVEKDHFIALLQSNYIWTPGAVMYRRTIFNSYKGFSTLAGGSADYELNIRIARKEHIGCHGHVILEYRKHGSSMSKNLAYMLKSGVNVRKANYHFVKFDQNLYLAWEKGIQIIQDDLGNRLLIQIEEKICKITPRKGLIKDIFSIIIYHPNGAKDLFGILKKHKFYNLLFGK